MEACGGAHHWARQFTALGHTVRLLHAKVVRPFVTGNKTDVTDARAIWPAVQQPNVKLVGMKTAEQQATLTLHRQRELLMKMRNMQSNALRGLLYEFGAVFAKGQRALFSELEPTLDSLSGQLPQMVADSLREQLTRIKALGEDIARIDRRLALQLRADPQMRRIAQIPAWAPADGRHCHDGQPSAFKSGREFCAWLGLVPNQTRHRRQSTPGQHLQTRRYLFAHLAHSRRQKRAHPCQTARAMARSSQPAPAPQRSDRGASSQNGTHHLGADGQVTRLSAGPSKRQADQSLFKNERAMASL